MKATIRQSLQTLLLLLVVALSFSVQAERKLLDQVVAIVDDDVILQTELEARINTIAGRLQAQGTGLPPQRLLEERVLEQLITESVQLQMADKMGMRISDNELNETIANIAERNGMSLPEFEEQLAVEGVSYRQAREQIRQEMITGRVQQRQVSNRVRVTDREVENYLQARESGGNDAEYRLAYIFIELDNPGDDAAVDATREYAQELRTSIVNGRDFREVAVAESDASNALEGGDMGWRSEGQLPSLVAPVVPDLEVGQPSEVLENNSGFHMVMVMEKRGGEQKQVIQQNRVRHILIRPSQAVTDAEAEATIRELARQIEEEDADFAALARQYSDDPVSGSDGGNLGWVSPGQMVPAFEEAMQEAAVGEFKGPFRSQFGWHILQVEERRQKDVSGDVKQAEARQAIYRRKFETELQNWLREIRDEAFVEFKGEYAREETSDDTQETED
ncbi:peptidylprolyl isomerase [Marinobacter piscensis]|uniref:peptidylprolyl isomerase n=1 Tax=Marinobacter piscensis TaxID=1562308 RepID=UPI0011A8229C|nr:peptidylprolyl isomerase [Marinobacter piscensis]